MKWRNVALGTVALFVLWSVLDMIIHGFLLGSQYAASPALFRPMEEMKMPLLYFTVLVASLLFTLLYGLNAPRGDLRDSLLFGGIYGVSTGFGMGFATYSIMPISLGMAWGWFLGAIVEATLAGLVLHWVFQPKRA